MSVQFKMFSSFDMIERNTWNDMAWHAGPMMEWEYFNALEASGAVSPVRGYRPSHLMMYEDGEPIALAPLYERDRAWVEFGDGGLLEFLSEVTGLPFHNGLVGAIPLTPVPGYQFLSRPDLAPEGLARQLLNYIDFMCASSNLLSSRLYFLSPGAPYIHRLLYEMGYIGLRSQYCMWLNRGYSSFDDYLRTFRSNRRTKIKRELRSIQDQGIEIRMIPAEDAPDSYYDIMYKLYISTWSKHMGMEIRPFLNKKFFELLRENFRHRNSFSVATSSGDVIGMALFYHKNESLYGRYWGCFDEIPFLHFATCYYYPIEYAIHSGFKLMDPGFGGEHKLYRGYETMSAYHYIKFHGEKHRRTAHAILEKMQAHTTTREDRI